MSFFSLFACICILFQELEDVPSRGWACYWGQIELFVCLIDDDARNDADDDDDDGESEQAMEYRHQ